MVLNNTKYDLTQIQMSQPAVKVEYKYLLEKEV